MGSNVKDTDWASPTVLNDQDPVERYDMFINIGNDAFTVP